MPYAHTHAWHLYIVRLDLEAVSLDRDAFMGALDAEGVGTGLHFPPLHTQAYYREKYGHSPESLPVAYDQGERILSLPLYPGLTDEQQERVLETIERVVAAHRRVPA